MQGADVGFAVERWGTVVGDFRVVEGTKGDWDRAVEGTNAWRCILGCEVAKATAGVIPDWR